MPKPKVSHPVAAKHFLLGGRISEELLFFHGLLIPFPTWALKLVKERGLKLKGWVGCVKAPPQITKQMLGSYSYLINCTWIILLVHYSINPDYKVGTNCSTVWRSLVKLASWRKLSKWGNVAFICIFQMRTPFFVYYLGTIFRGLWSDIGSEVCLTLWYAG